MEAALFAHPAFPSLAVDRIGVTVERASPMLLRIRYVVHGRVDDLVLPPPAQAIRADELWRTTCLEAFLAPLGWPGYCELNFSPSSRWAAYDFPAYRTGGAPAGLPAEPGIELSAGPGRLELVASLSLDLSQGPYRLGLCAVIEEKSGTKSYWALAHPPGEPDFHHPDCFALELPAAPAA